MNPTMVWLSLGTWVVVCACDGRSGSADRPPLPGIADEEQASASIRQVQSVDGVLASGDPDRIVNQVEWLFASASLIVIVPPPVTLGPAPSPSRVAAASQHSASCDAGSNGSASCDAGGCIFSQYRHLEADGELAIIDGRISVANLGSGSPTVVLDFMREGCQEDVGPNHYAGAWIRTTTRLEGSLHKTFELPGLDDELVRFESIALTDDQPTGGRLYAKWVTDEFGSYDATVSFP
jgi:hypothetical protein